MDWISIVSNVGFPIATVGYLLLRMEKIIEKNTEATTSLYELVKAKLK